MEREFRKERWFIEWCWEALLMMKFFYFIVSFKVEEYKFVFWVLLCWKNFKKIFRVLELIIVDDGYFCKYMRRR